MALRVKIIGKVYGKNNGRQKIYIRKNLGIRTRYSYSAAIWLEHMETVLHEWRFRHFVRYGGKVWDYRDKVMPCRPCQSGVETIKTYVEEFILFAKEH